MLLFCPPILYVPLYAVCVFWAAAAIGIKLLRLLRVSDDSLNGWERGVLSAALGVGLLQFIPFGLGIFGALHPRPLRIALILLMVLLAPEMLRIARGAGLRIRALRFGHYPFSLRAWYALLALYCGTLCLGTFWMTSVGDDDGYHLTASRRWLEAGSLIYLPTYSHTNSPMGFEMLYVCALASCDAMGAKMMHFTAGIACLFTLALLARRLKRGGAGIIALSLWLLPTPMTMTPSLFQVALNDLGVCWMTAASVLAWLAWRERRETPLLVVTMLCAGFAGSFKFTAFILSGALLVVIVWECARNAMRWKDIGRLAVLAYAVAILPVLPWLGRNFAVTSNPVYPLLSGIFPTRDWSAEQARVFTLFFKYYNWAIASGSALSLARRKEIVMGGVLAILAALCVLLRFDKDTKTRQLGVVIALMFVADFLSTGATFRFWLPADMLGFALAGAYWARYAPTKKWGAWPAALLLGMGFVLFSRNGKAYWPAELRVAIGQIPQSSLYRDDEFGKTWAYLNANTPRSAHVLLAAFYPTCGLSNGGAFFCNRDCYVTDSHLQDCIHLVEWTSFLKSLNTNKITYVVISDIQFNPNRQGFAYPAGQNEYAFCRRLADERGDKVAQFDHFQIYKLRDVSPK